ncbi:TEER-decreasing protein [Mycena galopus ATCC 62051]|nr:TEER-decreasing protein [Mycena galopus ATCC 62051]
MSGPGPETTWQELSNLGWPRQQAYNVFNARRGGTMEGLQDMAMNEGFALDWGWYSYNVLVGDPRLVGQGTDQIDQSSIVWTYDNTHNLQPFQATWTETWTNSSRASLAVSQRSTIALSQSINIRNVASSEFSFTIESDSTREETQETSHELSTTWVITIEGGERVHIERVRTIVTGQAIYNQDLLYQCMMIDRSPSWSGLWGMNMNSALGSPRGTMALRGTSTQESFVFRIVRTRPDGRSTVEPLPPTDGKSVTVIMSKKCGTENPHMVPGEEKETK